MLLIWYVVANPIYLRNYVNNVHTDVVLITTRKKNVS